MLSDYLYAFALGGAVGGGVWFAVEAIRRVIQYERKKREASDWRRYLNDPRNFPE
jgi:hypothetical protein